uniref:Peptidase S1 domain-containing protein n=1 Tax=Pristionchus pacificus TaxID=54126 RepID=A0A8R1V546_PRIPA
MIYLLLTLPLLISPQEYGSRMHLDGNTYTGGLNYFTQQGRSIGGIETKPHAWPWMVQLVKWYGHTCGGSLIDRSFVVTAAHCVDDVSPSQLKIYTGGHNSETGQEHKVLNISVHPLYHVIVSMSYDFAIIKISPSVTFNETIQPISLPLLPPLNNQMCVVAGWGRTSERGRSSTVLREIRVPIIPTYECNNFFHYAGSIDPVSMLCAGIMRGGIGSCYGDSGGPLMCERAGKWELQGVVLWARKGCARPDYPTVYARVLSAIPFIKFSMFRLR